MLKKIEYILSTEFDAWGVARIEPIDEEIARLKEWITQGHHAEMQYMTRNIELRANPCELLPNAKSMIMVLMNYYPHHWQSDSQPRIAAYAYGNDYHHIIKSKLTKIAEEINNITPHQYAVFCDSAPVLERYWAMRAGLGLRFVRELEQGKKTLRVDKVNQALEMFGAKLCVGRIDKDE